MTNEGKKDREKQRISHMMSFSEWILDQVLGEIAKRIKFY